MSTSRKDFGKHFLNVLFVFECLLLSMLFFVGCDGHVEGDLRLSNGSTEREGRVEIYHDGEWGTICDDCWDDADATVVCRQLGRGKFGEAVEMRKFPKGSGKIMLDDVDCSGEEEFLVNCSSKPWGEHDCRHMEDALVRCKDNCTSASCQNGNTCHKRAKSYGCSCPDNFAGYNSQWEKPSESQTTSAPTYGTDYHTVELNIHEERQAGSTQLYTTREKILDTYSSLYSLLFPYMVHVALSVGLQLITVICLMCWIRRKFARLRNWERRDSFFSSDNEFALTMGEYNINETNEEEGEDDSNSEYEKPKSEEEILKDTMENFHDHPSQTMIYRL